LYDKYVDEMKYYCKDYHLPKFAASRAQNNTQTLIADWGAIWARHKMFVAVMQKQFTYLDRFHTASDNNANVMPLALQGYTIFFTEVFVKSTALVKEAIIREINRERNEEEIKRESIKAAVLSFEEIGKETKKNLQVYKDNLEAPLIAEAKQFYDRVSATWIASDDAPAYLIKVEKMLAQEKDRVASYLNRSTNDPLREAVYAQLLKKHQMALLDKPTGLNNMLLNNQKDNLQRLYSLYKLDEKDLIPISEKFHDVIVGEGKRIVQEAQQAKKPADGKAQDVKQDDHRNSLVSRLIYLHDQYENIVRENFENNPLFQRSLKKAFETFINIDENVSKLLAEYAHEVLKKGSKINTEAMTLESVMNNISYLYFYITDKDVFEGAYQNHLQTRLLNDEYENEHSEKSMISKLKHGNFQYTNKLEGMFKDVQSSKEIVERFLKSSGSSALRLEREAKDKSMQFEVTVCSTQFWPRATGNDKCIFPADVRKATDAFTKFYNGEHKSHKLDWRIEKGNAEVKVVFNPSATRILVVSSYQMMIMLCFNSKTLNDKGEEVDNDILSKDGKLSITWDSLTDMLGLQASVLVHHLLSLCHPKIKVVLKDPNNIELEGEHSLQVNSSYSNPLKRIVIPTMQPPKMLKDQQEEEEKAKKARRNHQIDGAVVRIMKARKTMKHNDLVAEVITQLSSRFRPQSQDIKRRIEQLIDQAYLERLVEDRSTYKYLA